MGLKSLFWNALESETITFLVKLKFSHFKCHFQLCFGLRNSVSTFRVKDVPFSTSFLSKYLRKIYISCKTTVLSTATFIFKLISSNKLLFNLPSQRRFIFHLIQPKVSPKINGHPPYEKISICKATWRTLRSYRQCIATLKRFHTLLSFWRKAPLLRHWGELVLLLLALLS